MKGIAHFVTGVAIATFFPQVVESAANGSILPVLGGIAGLLPDTLDFKIVRYLEIVDVEIDPGPEPDAHQIAARLAETMRRAYGSGRPRSVMLHTIRLGADRWRRYIVRFDSQLDDVVVRIGPVVDTAGNALPASKPDEAAEARVQVAVPVAQTCHEITVDVFSGPSLRFEREGERLCVRFLVWHRRWSHSLTLAVALGSGVAGAAALAARLTAVTPGRTPLWAGMVVALGLLAHIVQDQLGFMGCNLLFPLTRRRTRGLGLLHSGDAIPNFLTVWVGLMVILFNLDRFSAQPRLNSAWFLGLTVAMPVLVMGGVYQRRRDRSSGTEKVEGQEEILSETEGTGIG